MRSFLILVFLLFFSLNSFSQENHLMDKYISAFHKDTRFYHEYFYTQFNKSNYFPGENIWFQVYIVDKQKERLSKITKKIYADFYNSKGILLERMILKANEGIAQNTFQIPADYNEKDLYLKVSTVWSMNFEKEFIDRIQVNIDTKTTKTKMKPLKEHSGIWFFPESGNLVEDVPTRVGVKVVDQYNNGFFFSGEIEDEEGNLVTIFKTNEKGLGRFDFHPEKNKHYRLRKFVDSISTVDLPLIKKTGAILNVLETAEEFRIFIRTNKFNSNSTFHYIIYNRYNIALAGTLNFNGGITSLQVLKKSDLFKGLNTITLFDAHFNPVAERIFFNGKGINLDHKILAVTGHREKDSVNIMLYNKGKDSVFNVGISVLPKESISQNPVRTFLSDYYLNSEVRGHIEDPKYYFESKTKIKDLDYLLMTQGWRMFDWKKIGKNSAKNEGKRVFKHLFETGIQIQGKVVNKQNSVPLTHENVSVFYHNTTAVTPTDQQGKFIFPNMDIYKNDTIRLYVNPDRKLKKKIVTETFLPVDSLLLNLPEKHQIYTPISRKKIYNENFETSVNIYNDGEQLDEVKLFVKKGKRIEEIDSYVNPMDNTTFTNSFYVNAENVYKYSSVMSYLESLPGLEIIVTGTDIKIYSSRTMQQRILDGGPKPMDIYIDNTKLTDLDIETLKLLDLSVVRNINVNKSGIGWGSQSPYGRITIYLNYGAAISKSRMVKKEETSNVLEFLVSDGFSRNKKYFSPGFKFSPKEELYKKYAVLFWKPDLKITKTGKGFWAKIPENINNCILLIEGISEKGNLISLKKELMIK